MIFLTEPFHLRLTTLKWVNLPVRESNLELKPSHNDMPHHFFLNETLPSSVFD